MTVIMYLAGLSLSRVVNTASQRELACADDAQSAASRARRLYTEGLFAGRAATGGILPSDAQSIQLRTTARVFPAPQESQYVLKIRSLSVQQVQWRRLRFLPEVRSLKAP